MSLLDKAEQGDLTAQEILRRRVKSSRKRMIRRGVTVFWRDRDRPLADGDRPR